MTNLTNMKRDSVWQGLQSPLPVSSGSPAAPTVQTDGFVYSNVPGFATADGGTSTGNNMKFVGCLMVPPSDGEALPYRVKAYGTAPDNDVYVVSGFADPASSNPTVINPVYFPFVGGFDEIIMMPENDPDNLAVVFGVGYRQLTDAQFLGTISVQCTWFGHPRFGTAIY